MLVKNISRVVSHYCGVVHSVPMILCCFKHTTKGKEETFSLLQPPRLSKLGNENLLPIKQSWYSPGNGDQLRFYPVGRAGILQVFE